MNRYGLLGHKLSHSSSKVIHEYYFNKNNILATYDLIEIEEEELETQIKLLRSGHYSGLNVTIPYKEKVIKYLDVLTPAAETIGAVNTLYVKDGMVVGDNTDYLGFIDELSQFDINVENCDVYVLGSGGASKGICYALKLLHANPIIVSRDNKKGITYDMLSDIDNLKIVVNTTSVGMYPNVKGEILPREIVEKIDICVDLICKPKVTKFLEYSKNGYNGNYMLIYQALHAEILWGNDGNIDVLDLYEKL